MLENTLNDERLYQHDNNSSSSDESSYDPNCTVEEFDFSIDNSSNSSNSSCVYSDDNSDDFNNDSNSSLFSENELYEEFIDEIDSIDVDTSSKQQQSTTILNKKYIDALLLDDTTDDLSSTESVRRHQKINRWAMEHPDVTMDTGSIPECVNQGQEKEDLADGINDADYDSCLNGQVYFLKNVPPLWMYNFAYLATICCVSYQLWIALQFTLRPSSQSMHQY